MAKNMAKLVGTIAELNTKQLEELAQGLAWLTTGTGSAKAERLEFFLNTFNREQKEKFNQWTKQGVATL